jgi:methylated-DNA-[protein]-cysteine S-methyltransferase
MTSDTLLATATATSPTPTPTPTPTPAAAVPSGGVGVALRTVDSPYGPLLLAATPAGVVRIAWQREDADGVRDRLARDLGPRVVHAPDRLDGVARQLDEYFAGRRRTFDLPVDLRLARGFRRTVLDRLRTIPYGTTESYASVATQVGSPRAARAVGSACATNPLPIVVPCHRVVRGDGVIGAFLGGTETKRALLALEAA